LTSGNLSPFGQFGLSLSVLLPTSDRSRPDLEDLVTPSSRAPTILLLIGTSPLFVFFFPRTRYLCFAHPLFSNHSPFSLPQHPPLQAFSPKRFSSISAPRLYRPVFPIVSFSFLKRLFPLTAFRLSVQTSSLDFFLPVVADVSAWLFEPHHPPPLVFCVFSN